MNKHVSEKLGEPLISKNKKRNSLFFGFDASSLYPRAVADFESILFIIESGHAFTKDMNNDLVNSFSIHSFTKGRANLTIQF